MKASDKSITDAPETVKIAKRFARANENRNGHFGKFEWEYAHGWV